MKLEYIVFATAIVISAPAVAEEYPVYQGSPNKETFDRQWVGEAPQTREEAVTVPALKNRVNYKIDAQNVDGTLEIHVEKIGIYEFYQDFLVIQSQEQTMYRPKCKALVDPGIVLMFIGGGTAIIGMLVGAGGLAAEDNEVATVGGIMLGGGFAVELGAGFGIVVPCSKFGETNQTRTQELSRNTETRLMQSNQYGHKPASYIPFTVSSPYFTYHEDHNAGTASGLHTDHQGTASVQLQPTDSGFAFTQEGLASIAYVQQLRKAGYSPQRFMPLLMQNAVPVTYTVTIETKATDGENARLDVPVQGWTIPQKALEQIVMGL